MANIIQKPMAEASVDTAWLSHDPDNPTMCVNLTDEAYIYLVKKGVTTLSDQQGAGIEGHINTQLPLGDASSEIYLGSSHPEDSLEGVAGSACDETLDEVTKFVNDVLEHAKTKVNWRDEEHYEMFGTKNIQSHDNGLEHGYYDGSSLTVLENLDTGEAYITLSLGALDSKYYMPFFKTFKSLVDAKMFIKDSIRSGETLQDCSITHRIWTHILLNSH